MTNSISHALLQDLSRLISHHLGLHFPKNRWRALARGITSAAREFGFEDAEICIKWLLTVRLEKKQIEILASNLTIGETHFFRERKTFEILEESILPELINSRMSNRRCLRIWSAACSSGEEPYSLAILLNKLIPDIKNWQITILATDINPRALKKAASGVYGEWSFRGTPDRIKEKYFVRKSENRYEVIPAVKQMVTFSYLNLIIDVYPSLLNNSNAMDLIFCRNVLMYFTPEQSGKIVRQLNRCLVNGGWLITSPVDAPHLRAADLVPVSFQEGTIYQKNKGQARLTKDASVQSIVSPENSFSHSFNYPGSTNSPSAQFATEPVKDAFSQKNNERRSLYEEVLRFDEQGQSPEATDKASKPNSLKPEDAKAYAVLAREYANQGKLEEALYWGKKAVDSDKSSADAHYLMSIILQEKGQVEEAIESLKRTLYLKPDFVQAHFAAGNLLRQKGSARESEKYFRNALALLSSYDREEVLPDSAGLNAGRLMEIIRFTLNNETPA